MNGKVRVSIVVTGLGGEVIKNKPTLSVVQNRNHGYSNQIYLTIRTHHIQIITNKRLHKMVIKLI